MSAPMDSTVKEFSKGPGMSQLGLSPWACLHGSIGVGVAQAWCSSVRLGMLRGMFTLTLFYVRRAGPTPRWSCMTGGRKDGKPASALGLAPQGPYNDISSPGCIHLAASVSSCAIARSRLVCQRARCFGLVVLAWQPKPPPLSVLRPYEIEYRSWPPGSA